MDAHGLHFCHGISRTALATLHRRLDLATPDDLRPRLAVDMLVAAFHCALGTWASPSGTPACGDFAARLRDACAALPGSLTLTVNLRPQ